MRSINNIAEELFDKIRSRVANIKLGNSEGVTTTDPSDARFFEFQYKHRDLPIGAVTISLNEEGLLQVYFPNSMVEDADSNTADAWYGFLKELSKFSARNMLNYEAHNVTKERLDKKDYQFLTQRNQDEVMENRLHGTSQKSFLEQGTAKLIIKHKGTVDETKQGARSRNISAIYIENSEGERFKFANNYLPGARAMARHVSNEGHTRDDRGAHIVEIMKEMQDLKHFVRSVKRDEYVNEDAQEVIDAATDRYYGLKDTLKAVSSAKGYNDYFENWAPGAVEVEENDLEDLKQKLTREVYDDRLTDSLPSVRKAMDYKSNMEAKGDDEEDMDAPMKPYFDRSIDAQEPANLDAKADANIAKGAQSLADIADNDENIEVFDKPADIAELKNYMQFMKNSDMDVTKKNRSILVAIMKYLANNMTNDAAANSASEIELSDPAQQATALKLAKKYLQGKIEVKQLKAKKDLYGKDKTEDISFESFEENMEMVSEGTWALPDNEAEAMKLAAMMGQPIALGDAGDGGTNALGGLLGDDELFDSIGEAGDKDPEGDARPIIIGWMMDHVDDYGEERGEILKMALNKIRADGNDSEMVIPRMFSAPQNKSVTQGERMGSNADEVKANEEELDEMHMKSLKCEDCGDMLGQPTTDCPHDCNDPKGSNWVMVDVDNDGDMDMAVANEGRMSDLSQEVDEVIAAMEADMELFPFTNEFRNEVMKSYNIKAALEKVLPDYVAGSKITALVGEAVQEVDEVAESIAKMRAMAGVGSTAKSNHGIHEGEEGYQLTPRSIVARQMRKLQDIERSS
tara:strand:- start:25311 stop:27713 length:2403 start_codon:yes stop_codon:yes gene_type:complete